MKIANDLVIDEVVIKQNLRAFLDISVVKEAKRQKKRNNFKKKIYLFIFSYLTSTA